MSSNAASLMASLTGDAPAADDGEQDLFGDIPIDDPVATAAPTPNNNGMASQQDSSSNNAAGGSSIYHDPMTTSMSQQQPQPSTQQPHIQYVDPQPPHIQYQQPSNNSMGMSMQPNMQQQQTPPPNSYLSQSQPVMPSTTTTGAAPSSSLLASSGLLGPTATTTTAEPPTTTTPAETAPAPFAMPAAAANKSSLLTNSGLLGTAPGDSDEKKAESGGGLFDAIDEEEEQKEQAERQRQEQEQRQRQEHQQRQQEEQRRREQEQQEQQQRLQQQQMQMQQQQQQQQMQMQQQQYSMEARMQGLHLGGQQQQMHPHMLQNQQPQMQPQMQQNQQAQMQQNQQAQMQAQIQQNQMQQPQQQKQPEIPSPVHVPGVLYRDHPAVLANNAAAASPNKSNTYQGRAAAMAASHQQQQSPHSRYYHPSMQGQVAAGMHNTTTPQHGQQHPQLQRVQAAPPIVCTKPPPVPTYYGKVTVNDPVLLQPPAKLLGMVSSPPHWSYQITTQIKGQQPGQSGGCWMVRRRFNNVVALEDRLRIEVPGAILPPRPDKHVGRAIEEASTNQSPEFAWQRAAEIESYLNQLTVHPEVFPMQALKLFLGLQDDLGTAWPECSSNVLTKISAAGVSAAANLVDQTTQKGGGFFSGSATAAPGATSSSTGGAGGWGNIIGGAHDADLQGTGVTEDSAELLSLSSSESLRMGAVLQAVPKLEGAVTLLREQGEVAGAVGMELNRLAKEVLSQGDRELATPLEIFSNGLLRYGRRTKRLGVEVTQATITAFQFQYKLCRYEKMAWIDRRNALVKRQKERGRADQQAQQLMMHQNPYQPQMGGRYGGGAGGYGGGYGGQQYNPNMGQVDQLERNATMSDEMAVSAVRECDEIGARLKREVNRVSYSRRMEWSKSVKVIASYMKEACTERVAIWESTRDSFLQSFPEYQGDNGTFVPVVNRVNPGMGNSYMAGSSMTPPQAQSTMMGQGQGSMMSRGNMSAPQGQGSMASQPQGSTMAGSSMSSPLQAQGSMLARSNMGAVQPQGSMLAGSSMSSPQPQGSMMGGSTMGMSQPQGSMMGASPQNQGSMMMSNNTDAASGAGYPNQAATPIG